MSLGFEVLSLGFEVSGLGFEIWGLGFQILDLDPEFYAQNEILKLVFKMLKSSILKSGNKHFWFDRDQLVLKGLGSRFWVWGSRFSGFGSGL